MYIFVTVRNSNPYLMFTTTLLSKKSTRKLQLHYLVFCFLFAPFLNAQNTPKDQNGNAPYTKVYNLTSFSNPKKSNLEQWKKHNLSKDYAHPEFGLLSNEAPCSDCIEVISKRKEDEKYYVDLHNTSLFYIQKALGDLHYKKDGQWLTIDSRIQPIGPNLYESNFYPEPVGIEVAKNRTYIKTPKGKVYFNSWTLWSRNQGVEQMRAKANWSNYTIGEDGMYIHNIFDGIDAELIVFRGAIKTNFIMKKNKFGTFDELIFKDEFQHQTALQLDFTEAPGNKELNGTLSVSNSSELISVSPAILYPKGGDKSMLQHAAYAIKENKMGIVVPYTWIASLIDEYELIIDPLVSGSNTLAQASITGSRYNASCNFTNSCNYNLSVIQPAATTLTDVTFSFSYIANGTTCWLLDGAFRLATSTCLSPAAAGYYWFCNSIGGGTCAANNISIFSDLQSCLPAPNCAAQTIPFELRFYRSCWGATGCSSTCIGAASPLTITVYGRTTETPATTSGGINVSSTTVCQNSSMAVSTNGGQYGVPPYTYTWSFNATGTPAVGTGLNPTITFPVAGAQTLYLLTSDSCGNIATNAQNITVNPMVIPSVSIVATPSGQICPGTSVTFTAIPINGGTTPIYQWKKNSLNVGTNSDTYTDSSLNNGDSITVELVSNLACASGLVTSLPYVVAVASSNNPEPDVVSLPALTASCSLTVTSALFPTATNPCTGEVVTATTTDPLTYTSQGTYTITWQYVDANGHTASQTQQVIINDTTAPVPDVATLPVVNGQCEVTTIPAPTATDNCDGVLTATTTTTFPITTSTTVVWTFVDASGNTITQNQSVVVQDTTAPVADVATLPVVNGQCQVTSIAAPTATDNCDGVLTATTTTTFPITTSTTVVWTFVDASGNTITQNQSVVVQDTTVPVADVATLPVVNAQCQVTTIAAPTATDNCDGVLTGTTTTTFPITASTTVVWTFVDATGNTATQNQSVVVQDTTAPVPDVATLPAVNAQCQVTTIPAPTATDNCDGVLTATTTTTFPITASTTVVWTFVDATGNSATQNQSVVIQDTTVPVADVAPLPVVNAQCQVTTIAAPTATDNCDGVLTATTTTSFPITASTTVVWTFVDASGNTITQNQSVVVQDTTAPVADVATLPAVNAQCQVTTIPAPTATDNCDGVLTGTTTTTFPITASTTVVWTFVDATGNSATQNQSVVIQDTTAPVADVATLPAVNAQCQVTSIPAPTATDNCDGVLTATTTTTFPITTSTTVVWTFVDASGNTITQNQSVVVQDTTAPVPDVATLPVVNAQCQVTTIAAPTATDNCDGVLTATTTTTFPITASTTVVWTFVDASGNTITQNQTVVIDVVNLVITNPAPVCSGNTVDITQAAITAGSTGGGTLSYWYDLAATNPILDPSSIAVSGTYYIQSSNGICSDIKPVEVQIKDAPSIRISGSTTCKNSYGTVTFQGTPYTMVTFNVDGGPDQFIPLDLNGYATLDTPFITNSSVYNLVSVSYQTPPFCSVLLTESATVFVVEPAFDFSYVVSEAFALHPTITITPINDNGFHLYQLDNGVPQSSNTFTDVSPGNHTITLLDMYACTSVTKQVTIIDYPKFFTPNGDGQNDYWNIIGMHQSTAKLYIFDRYGKLIKQISTLSNSPGWDGTFNGEMLPSSDYWFTIEYEEDNTIKTFKSHFSLKR